MSRNQKGFVPIILLVIVALAAVVAISAKSQENRPKVQGLEIARGGDDSSGSGGTGTSTDSNSSGSDSVSRSTVTTATTRPIKTPELEIDGTKPIRTTIPKPSERPEPSGVDEIEKQDFEVSDDGMEIKSGSISATSKFPITFNKTTNSLTVKTGEGSKEIRILPDQAALIATTSGIQSQIDKIELAQAQTQNTTVFKVSGNKTGKLFGLITISEPVVTEIDAGTGNVVSTSKPSFIFRLLSAFIQ